jgi:uncharacterized protein
MNAIERKKTIWYVIIYSLLVTGLAFISPLLGGSPTSPGLGFFVWGTAPLVVSLLMRAVTRDWSDLGTKAEVRKNIFWYLVSLFAYPVVMSLGLMAGTLFSASAISEFSLVRDLPIVLMAFPFFFIFAIFEEVGWRGYLDPKLTALGLNRYAVSALVAIVWATWHMPYIRELTWVYSAGDLSTFIPRFYLVCFAAAIVFGEIRAITGTFWPAVLMHGVGNAFGHPLEFEYVKVVTGQEYLGSVGNGLFMIAFMILLGVAINRWRTRRADTARLTESFA